MPPVRALGVLLTPPTEIKRKKVRDQTARLSVHLSSGDHSETGHDVPSGRHPARKAFVWTNQVLVVQKETI